MCDIAEKLCKLNQFIVFAYFGCSWTFSSFSEKTSSNFALTSSSDQLFDNSIELRTHPSRYKAAFLVPRTISVWEESFKRTTSLWKVEVFGDFPLPLKRLFDEFDVSEGRWRTVCREDEVLLNLNRFWNSSCGVVENLFPLLVVGVFEGQTAFWKLGCLTTRSTRSSSEVEELPQAPSLLSLFDAIFKHVQTWRPLSCNTTGGY